MKRRATLIAERERSTAIPLVITEAPGFPVRYEDWEEWRAEKRGRETEALFTYPTPEQVPFPSRTEVPLVVGTQCGSCWGQKKIFTPFHGSLLPVVCPTCGGKGVQPTDGGGAGPLNLEDL